jgi:hypothetical protein
MWILDNVVHFQTRPSYESATTTFIIFVKSNKIDLYNRANRSSLVAKYLCVVDEPWNVLATSTHHQMFIRIFKTHALKSIEIIYVHNIHRTILV